MGLRETEIHLQSFNSEDEQHLARVRRLRRHAWNNDRLDPLNKAVLGLTGSKTLLAKYAELVQKVDENIGEPIIRVQQIRDGYVSTALGGIICAPVLVDVSFDEKWRSGHFELSVPVNPVISFLGGPNRVVERVFANGDTSEQAVTAAKLYLAENDNYALDPTGDYREEDITVLIGRDEIYDSELFSVGVSRVLRAIEITEPVSVNL